MGCGSPCPYRRKNRANKSKKDLEPVVRGCAVFSYGQKRNNERARMEKSDERRLVTD